MSWINQGNYELARNCLSNLPPHGYNEAGTHFLNFMINSAQGNDQPGIWNPKPSSPCACTWLTRFSQYSNIKTAIQAIDRLMSSLDFKPETLLYAAQQASQRGLQKLLHYILQKTLEATSGAVGGRFIEGLDMVVLLRLAEWPSALVQAAVFYECWQVARSNEPFLRYPKVHSSGLTFPTYQVHPKIGESVTSRFTEPR